MSTSASTNLVLRVPTAGRGDPGAATVAAVAGIADALIGAGGEFTFDAGLLQDPGDREWLLQNARTALTDAGYTVVHSDEAVAVYSPLPVDAPSSIEQVAALIDPTRAQRAVAEIVAYLGGRADWNGGDLVAFLPEPLASAVAGAASMPDFLGQSTAAIIYWSRLVGHGDYA